MRERKDDIPLLAEHFLHRFNELNRKSVASIEPEVIAAFMEHEWPGNVRELENVIERAVVLCPADTISLRYLPRQFRDIGSQELGAGEGFNLLETEKRLLIKSLEAASWNQTKAAEMLGISRKQLRTKMKNHGLMADEGAQ